MSDKGEPVSYPETWDNGKPVVCVLDSGESVFGRIEIDDWTYDNDGDEVPSYVVKLDNGGDLNPFIELSNDWGQVYYAKTDN